MRRKARKGVEGVLFPPFAVFASSLYSLRECVLLKIDILIVRILNISESDCLNPQQPNDH